MDLSVVPYLLQWKENNIWTIVFCFIYFKCTQKNKHDNILTNYQNHSLIQYLQSPLQFIIIVVTFFFEKLKLFFQQGHFVSFNAFKNYKIILTLPFTLLDKPHFLNKCLITSDCFFIQSHASANHFVVKTCLPPAVIFPSMYDS